MTWRLDFNSTGERQLREREGLGEVFRAAAAVARAELKATRARGERDDQIRAAVLGGRGVREVARAAHLSPAAVSRMVSAARRTP